MRIAVISLESVSPGTAAAQHISGTTRRVRAIPYVDCEAVVIASFERGLVRRYFSVTRQLISAISDTDVAFVRFHPLLLLHVLFLRLKGLPIISSVQGVPGTVYNGSGLRSCIRPILDFAVKLQARISDVIVVPHEGVGATAESDYGFRHDLVLPNGFTPDVRFSARTSDSELLLDPDVNKRSIDGIGDYVLFVGSLAHWQGVQVMLQAVAHEQWPADVSLVIAGGGALSDAVESAARSTASIHYLGHVLPAEARSLMKNSRLTLSIQDRVDATKNGCTPFKVMESITYGVPVIVSALPGQLEMITETGAGCVIEPGDSQLLASTVGELLSGDGVELDMITKNAVEASNYFDWENEADTLLVAINMARNMRRAK